MNAKHCKFLRTLVRYDGHDPRETLAIPLKPVSGLAWSVRNSRFCVPYVAFSGQRALEPGCGRAMYRQYKKDTREQRRGQH